MYEKLIEAAKQQMSKGAFQLAFDNESGVVQVLDNKKGKINYQVEGEKDEMLISTLIYFGIN